MCLLTIAAYAGSLHGWFVYEDAMVREPSLRKLAEWSWRMTERVSDTPFAHRVVSLAWHTVNGVLVWLLARRVLGIVGALMAAGLFLLHPMQTETVAYLGSRPELALVTCVLLACLASSAGQVWMAGVFACLALVSKEMGVMAFALVPLWAWLTRHTWTPGMPEAWLTVSAVVGAVFLSEADRFLVLMPWAYYGSQVAELGRLLWLVPESLWNPTVLTIDHDWRWVTRPIAFAALVAAPCLLEIGWKYSRMALFALAWTLVALLPRLVLTLPDGIHERHLYLPMVGLSLALGSLWDSQ